MGRRRQRDRACDRAVGDDLIVGRKAYEAACRQYPKARVTLRQGIRVIEENGP